MQQYRKCCTHPIGVSVYKWVSERGSLSAAADVAFQRELVEFIRRKICSPCHAGSSESRTVNRSALMENNGSPSIYSSRYRTNGASVWPARPACLSRTCRANRAHDFARVFRVRLLCRVVDTEALRDRCGRCRALDCSQDSGASEFLNLSSQHRATDTAVEFGVVTTDIHGNGRFTVVVGPIASGT